MHTGFCICFRPTCAYIYRIRNSQVSLQQRGLCRHGLQVCTRCAALEWFFMCKKTHSCCVSVLVCETLVRTKLSTRSNHSHRLARTRQTTDVFRFAKVALTLVAIRFRLHTTHTHTSMRTAVFYLHITRPLYRTPVKGAPEAVRQPAIVWFIRRCMIYLPKNSKSARRPSGSPNVRPQQAGGAG